MDSLGGTLLIGVAAFAATNLDDLFLLVVFFAIGWGRARDVVLGQYAGIGALFMARQRQAHCRFWIGREGIA